MKVLFLGQTGIDKRACVEKLARHCLAAHGLPADLDNINSRKHLRVFHLEDFIGQRMAGDYIAFLDKFYSRSQSAEWDAAWNSMLREIEDAPSDHTFITFHATYFRRNRFFSVANTNLLRAFEPDVVITLIDDAFECWHRIQERERLHPRGTNLRLRDIFIWRTVEIMAGDLLFHDPELINFVVATKHPAEMFQRLIFRPDIKRVYASFPISSTRDDIGRRSQVDEFRKSLHEQFTVFDPLTIDERLLASALENSGKDNPEVTINLDQRWPPWFGEELDSMATPYDSNYPIVIPAEQIAETVIDIDRQIEARDFRLIDSVQSVAAYRPSFNGRQSRGVAAELQYAAQTVGIPVHVTWDDDQDGTFGDSPFGALGTKHLGTSQIISALTE